MEVWPDPEPRQGLDQAGRSKANIEPPEAGPENRFRPIAVPSNRWHSTTTSRPRSARIGQTGSSRRREALATARPPRSVGRGCGHAARGVRSGERLCKPGPDDAPDRFGRTSRDGRPGRVATGEPAASAAIDGEAITFPGPTVDVQRVLRCGHHAQGRNARRSTRTVVSTTTSARSRPASPPTATPPSPSTSCPRKAAAKRSPRAMSRPPSRNASTERLVGDMKAGLDELERRAPGAKLGAIGFCFGGGMVWALLDAGDERLAAAIPFYGPAPSTPDFSGNTAAVLGVYAEQDARVNASRDTAEAALDGRRPRARPQDLPGRRPRLLQRHRPALQRRAGGCGLRRRPRLARSLPGLTESPGLGLGGGSRAEIGQHRAYAPMVAIALGQPELAHDAADVRLHRSLSQP